MNKVVQKQLMETGNMWTGQALKSIVITWNITFNCYEISPSEHNTPLISFSFSHRSTSQSNTGDTSQVIQKWVGIGSLLNTSVWK